MEVIRIRRRLEELPQEIEGIEIAYIMAKAEEEHLKDMKKHLIHTLKSQATGTNANKETVAYASKEYEIHVNGAREAAVNTGTLGAKFHKLQNELDAMRSLNKNI